MHIGWQDGHVPEFSTAYTLHRHEVRLNLMGRSSFAFGNKVELSIYIPLQLTPNFALKYKFVDKKYFASALEIGAAVGIFPLGVAAAIVMPGGGVGGGTIGLLNGWDVHLKSYFSFPVTNKLCFSFRGSVSTIHAGYLGGAIFAGLGGNGGAVGIIPVRESKQFYFFSGGFETDYVINKINVIVWNTYLGGFYEGSKQIGMSTLAWTHAKKHFHYTLGLYGFFDPPSFEMVKESKLPVSVFANIYWIFNNGKVISKIQK